MKTVYATLSLAALIAMAILTIAIIGKRIDQVPAAITGFLLFVGMMWASGRIGTDL